MSTLIYGQNFLFDVRSQMIKTIRRYITIMQIDASVVSWLLYKVEEKHFGTLFSF